MRLVCFSDCDTFVTSSEKMAALFLSSDEMQGIHALSDTIDEKLIEFLSSRDSKNLAIISKQINVNFTKSALLEARRNIYDYAVEKEKGNRALATNEKDATSIDSDERLGIHMHDMSKWQLTNHGTKPRITVDIMRLSLFIDDPREEFPTQVLATMVAKAKAKPNTSKSSTISSCLTDVEQSIVRNAEGDVVDPVSIQKEFERFVIREVCGSDTQNLPPDNIPVSVTKLTETGTSTRDLVSTRTFAATQTDESSFGNNANNDLGSDLRVLAETYNKADNRELSPTPAPVNTSPTHDNADVSAPHTSAAIDTSVVRTESDNPLEVCVNPESSTPTVRTDNVNKANSTASVHSDTSLLEYIDSEYESIKNMNKGKLPIRERLSRESNMRTGYPT